MYIQTLEVRSCGVKVKTAVVDLSNHMLYFAVINRRLHYQCLFFFLVPNYLIPSYVFSVATSWFSLSPSHWQYPTQGAPASGWMNGEGDGEEEGRQFAPVMGLLCPHMLFSLSLVTRGGMCCAWRQMVWSRFLLEPEGRRREVAGKWMKKVGGQWERNRKKWRDYSQNPELTVRNPLIEKHTAATVNLYFGQDEETKNALYYSYYGDQYEYIHIVPFPVVYDWLSATKFKAKAKAKVHFA